jgi:hypothetical protein
MHSAADAIKQRSRSKQINIDWGQRYLIDLLLLKVASRQAV